MHANPYENLEKKYKLGKIYKGVVTKCVDYGAFVKLEEGLEGLVHTSQISWTKKNAQSNKILSPSQEINVKIIELDAEKKMVTRMDLFKDPVALEELYDYLDKIDLKKNSLLGWLRSLVIPSNKQ